MSIVDRRAWTRRWVHIAFGGCAFLIGILGRRWSLLLALAALFYNGMLAPCVGLDRSYRRPGESRWSGLTTYPLAVCLLLLFAPLPVAAGAWIVMATADPVAAVVGTRRPWPHVPGNPRKSLCGSAAGLSAGTLTCSLLLATMGVHHPLLPALAAAAGGVVAEALPLPIDDNLPVALGAAAGLLAWGL